jgi:hypothetical protein
MKTKILAVLIAALAIASVLPTSASARPGRHPHHHR